MRAPSARQVWREIGMNRRVLVMSAREKTIMIRTVVAFVSLTQGTLWVKRPRTRVTRIDRERFVKNFELEEENVT